MTITKGRIERAGSIRFHDASLHVWEEGLRSTGSRAGWDAQQGWERQFKHDVFKRIVAKLRQLGFTVGPNTHIFTGNNNRFASKGALKADLKLGGRHIELDFFQNVNAPTRPDHGGRYEFNQEELMPYLMRLEMERARRSIREYLLNVFTGYEFEPPKVASPNPDPLAYFNDHWDGEYEKRRGTHRFRRGDDGWPSVDEISSWDRKDKDGMPLNHGDVRWLRDRKGRLMRGRVYGGINGMWMFVYGPDRRDHTHENAKRFFTYRPDETPRKFIESTLRHKRLEHELAKAVETMNFERAAVLRDIAFPGNPELFNVWHDEHQLYHCAGFSGYTRDQSKAGKFTAGELRGWDKAPNRIVPIAAEAKAA